MIKAEELFDPITGLQKGFETIRVGKEIREYLENLERELAEALAEIKRLRAIPMPHEPHNTNTEGWQIWHDCVQHYESHLRGVSLLDVSGPTQIKTKEDARKFANLQMKIEDPTITDEYLEGETK